MLPQAVLHRGCLCVVHRVHLLSQTWIAAFCGLFLGNPTNCKSRVSMNIDVLILLATGSGTFGSGNTIPRRKRYLRCWPLENRLIVPLFVISSENFTLVCYLHG